MAIKVNFRKVEISLKISSQRTTASRETISNFVSHNTILIKSETLCTFTLFHIDRMCINFESNISLQWYHIFHQTSALLNFNSMHSLILPNCYRRLDAVRYLALLQPASWNSLLWYISSWNKKKWILLWVMRYRV